jgi:hypothetical protein
MTKLTVALSKFANAPKMRIPPIPSAIPQSIVVIFVVTVCGMPLLLGSPTLLLILFDGAPLLVLAASVV